MIQARGVEVMVWWTYRGTRSDLGKQGHAGSGSRTNAIIGGVGALGRHRWRRGRVGVGMDAPLDCTSYAHPRAKACFALMFASPPERGDPPAWWLVYIGPAWSSVRLAGSTPLPPCDDKYFASSLKLSSSPAGETQPQCCHEMGVTDPSKS